MIYTINVTQIQSISIRSTKTTGGLGLITAWRTPRFYAFIQRGWIFQGMGWISQGANEPGGELAKGRKSHNSGSTWCPCKTYFTNCHETILSPLHPHHHHSYKVTL